jgi:cytidylate kinase
LYLERLPMARPEKSYDAQFRIVITRTMKTRLERAAKREGIPNAEFARRALQERIDRAAAEAKRQAAERKAAKVESPVPRSVTDEKGT